MKFKKKIVDKGWVDVDRDLARLEKAAQEYPWQVAGTVIQRVLAQGEGSGVEWSLGLGGFQRRKTFFNASSLTEVINAAKAFYNIK